MTSPWSMCNLHPVTSTLLQRLSMHHQHFLGVEKYCLEWNIVWNEILFGMKVEWGFTRNHYLIKVRPGFTFTCRIVSLKKQYRKLLIKRPGLHKAQSLEKQILKAPRSAYPSSYNWALLWTKTKERFMWTILEITLEKFWWFLRKIYLSDIFCFLINVQAWLSAQPKAIVFT